MHSLIYEHQEIYLKPGILDVDISQMITSAMCIVLHAHFMSGLIVIRILGVGVGEGKCNTLALLPCCTRHVIH